MANIAATQASVKPLPHLQTDPRMSRQPSAGAHAFCSILRPYMARTGPRAGWTKFSDEDKHAIINRHLERDGKRPISRATFYRWKREARDAGLLDFTSSAKRPGDRHRARGGRWLRVVEVPARFEGRRPRRLNETFSTPPPDETFSTTTKEEDLRDLSPQRDHAGSSSGAAEHAPSVVADFSPNQNHIEAENQLTAIAVGVSERLGVPWKPLPEKRTWRLGAIAKTLGKASLADYPELGVEVVGLALQRARDIERANERNRFHGFWEVAAADLVARALGHQKRGPFESVRWFEAGSRWLWNHHGIDTQADGFPGIDAGPPPLSRRERVHREAMVGAR